MNIIAMAEEAGLAFSFDGYPDIWATYTNTGRKEIECFVALVEAAARADEREAIAQMFKNAPALVQFAQNDQGGCLVCGFTPKLVIEVIRERGTT